MTSVIRFRKSGSAKMIQLEKCPDVSVSEEVIDQFFLLYSIAKEGKATLGDGLYEEVYQNALAVEIEMRGFEDVRREVPFDVMYKGLRVGLVRPDIVVRGADGFIVEVKRGDMYRGVHQLVQYLKVSKIPVGYLIGFQEEKLTVWPVLVGYSEENPDETTVYICSGSFENDADRRSVCFRKLSDVGRFT